MTIDETACELLGICQECGNPSQGRLLCNWCKPISASSRSKIEHEISRIRYANCHAPCCDEKVRKRFFPNEGGNI